MNHNQDFPLVFLPFALKCPSIYQETKPAAFCPNVLFFMSSSEAQCKTLHDIPSIFAMNIDHAQLENAL